MPGDDPKLFTELSPEAKALYHAVATRITDAVLGVGAPPQITVSALLHMAAAVAAAAGLDEAAFLHAAHDGLMRAKVARQSIKRGPG